MTTQLFALTGVTLAIALVSVRTPLRDRDWAQMALIAAIMATGYVLAFLLVMGHDVPSPIRLVERLTQAIINLFR